VTIAFHATQLQPVPKRPELVYSLCGKPVSAARLAPSREAVTCGGCGRLLRYREWRERRAARGSGKREEARP
jgi:hypothetical protein